MSSFSDDLLDQARALATKDKHKPKQANVRRAVSSAYYALFHFIISEATNQLVGNTSEASRSILTRAFDHGKMRALCEQFTRKQPKEILRPHWPAFALPNNDLTLLCESFTELQELRHQADYNLSGSVTRQEALNACDTASYAMNAWLEIKKEPNKLAHFFATALVIWPSLQSRS